MTHTMRIICISLIIIIMIRKDISISAINDRHYQLYRNARLETYTLQTPYTVRSKLDCVSRYVKTDGKRAFNFHNINKTCEIVSVHRGGFMILEPSDDWVFGITDICLLSHCNDSINCRQNPHFPYTCTCQPNFGGDSCNIPCDLEINDSCFWIEFEERKWQDAKSDCNQHGGRLAEIPDENTNNQLKAIAHAYDGDLWIGASYVTSSEFGGGTCILFLFYFIFFIYFSFYM